MIRRPVPLALAVAVAAVAAGFAVPGSAAASAGSGAPGLPYDPQRAPVVLIPGLVGSELTCGPDDQPPLNLWPGTFATFFPPKFGHLALINTDDGAGGVTSRTTSTADYPLGCGSEPYGPGTAARHEPVVPSPMWCLPENNNVNPDPVACAPVASDEYSSFGLAIRDRIASDGRGQIFASYPWDWRRSPAEQADGLQQLLEEVTARAGSRATVVAHSLGNLVFREWTRAAEGNGGALVGRFLSIAGPWWGVSTGWTHPAFGQIQPGVDGEQLSRYERLPETAQVFQTAPGTYWLFPNASFTQLITAQLGGEGWLAVPDGPGTSRWVPHGGVRDAAVEQFRLCPQSEVFPCQVSRLADLAQAGTPAPGFRTGGVDWIGIVGAGVATAGQICSGCSTFPDAGDGDPGAGAAQDGPQTVWSIRNVNGDENVPVFSGIQGTDPFAPPGDAVPFYFTCGVTHMGLVRDAPVLEQTVPFLLGDGELGYGGVFTREPCALPGPPEPVGAPPTFTG